MLASVFAHEVYVTSYRSATNTRVGYLPSAISFHREGLGLTRLLRAPGRVLNPRPSASLMSIDFKNIPPLDTKRKTNASRVIKKFDRARPRRFNYTRAVIGWAGTKIIR